MSLTIRESYALERPIYHDGCPCELVAPYQITTTDPEDRRALIHKFTTMLLAHYSKSGRIKSSFPLNALHYQLETTSLLLYDSGASNILISKVGFDCFITDSSGKTYRAYVTFDLRIPGANTPEQVVFSYDFIVKAYGSKKNLYETLKHFYQLGRNLANKDGSTHGHLPDYNPSSSKHDQYIRHTEQLLVAYLALPEAADMLCNRLRAELRGNYPDACFVKIYNMGLHMHSTKTCCAPCEYSLIGLMNDPGFTKNQKSFGFLANFKKACSVPNEQLSFTLPKKSSFRLLVTVTANHPDADHRSPPSYTPSLMEAKEPISFHTISVKSPQVSSHVFTTMLSSEFDRRILPLFPNLIDRTIGISGSKASPGSPGTMRQVQRVKQRELDQVVAMMGSAGLEEKQK